VGDLGGCVGARSPAAAQHRLDGGHQLARAERFDHVVIGAERNPATRSFSLAFAVSITIGTSLSLRSSRAASSPGRPGTPRSSTASPGPRPAPGRGPLGRRRPRAPRSPRVQSSRATGCATAAGRTRPAPSWSRIHGSRGRYRSALISGPHRCWHRSRGEAAPPVGDAHHRQRRQRHRGRGDHRAEQPPGE
jgi:hypothetical protein